MINSNLKTQVQARINAITTGTTLAELLRIRQAAKGLNCDETLLNNEVTAKLNALSGATSLDDLVAAGVLTDGPSNVLHYQVPHAVMPGDELWIDSLGLVTDRQYPYTAMASAVEAGGYPGLSNTVPMNTFRSGLVRSGSSTTAAFLIQLSDGNWLLGIGTPIDSGSTQFGLKIYVLSAGFDRIVSSTTVELRQSGSFTSQYSLPVGIREISANVFRVYYVQAVSASINPTSLTFHTLTYNTGTKAFTAAAGSIVHTLASGEFDLQRVSVRHNQGQRYQIVGSNSENLLCLDMQNGTVTSYTSVGVAGYPACEFDESTAGNEWGLVRNSSSAPFLTKAGTSTSKALPSNLVSDGCFGSGWRVRMLEPRRYLAKRANAGVCTVKLVAFDTTYDAASIWTLDAAHPDTASSAIGAAYKRADGLYIIENSAVGPTCFYWDGLTAPTNYRTLRRQTKGLGDVKAGCLAPTDKVIRAGYSESSQTSGATSRSTAFLCLNAGAFLPWNPGKIGRSLTSAAISALAEIELSENSRYVGDDLRTGGESPVSQLVMTMLPFDDSISKLAFWGSSGTSDEGDLYGPHAAEFKELENAGALTSLGSGAAVALDGMKPVLATASRSSDTGRSVALLTSYSFNRLSDVAGAASAGFYRVKSNKPFVLFVSGQSSSIAEGE